MAAVRSGAKEEAPPGSILLVIHDFVARSADELSLAKGDRIELIERDDDFGDGWFLGRHMSNGKTGLFPEGRAYHWSSCGSMLPRSVLKTVQSTRPRHPRALSTMDPAARVKVRPAQVTETSKAMDQLHRHSKGTLRPQW